MNTTPLLLFTAMAVMSCSGHLVKDSKDLMKKRDCSWLGCSPLLPNKRLERSLTEEQDKTVIYSDLPTDRVLQEVRSHYISSDEQAEIIQEENQEIDSTRQKRGVRVVAIRVCNRRTGRCRIIIITRRT